MRGLRGFRGIVLAAIGCAALAGCGGHGDRTPSLARLPLVPGARVTVDDRICNIGANAFCVLQLVVVGDRYPTSIVLERAERRLLRVQRWREANAPVGLERAADSPGDKVRVTYATASGDLEAVDLGWIKRARGVTLALSKTLLDRRSAMSMLLQLGTA